MVDSDDSRVHRPSHDGAEDERSPCRLCQLRAIYHRVARTLPRLPHRPGLMRAVGVAVPAVEAWYLCGRDESVSEARWCEGQERRRAPYTRAELKQRVYGTPRPTLALEIACALREVQRHRRDLRRLENDFPSFAALADDLRASRAAAPLRDEGEAAGAEAGRAAAAGG